MVLQKEKKEQRIYFRNKNILFHFFEVVKSFKKTTTKSPIRYFSLKYVFTKFALFFDIFFYLEIYDSSQTNPIYQGVLQRLLR